ncbi:hypothetical protein ACIPLR_17680 [Herbaspirillum huttiense]|uniref:hypothetical protein n=1 Tax=Herbaspirillum huttiense TaxID=863372 RepID=UPI00382B43ED
MSTMEKDRAQDAELISLRHALALLGFNPAKVSELLQKQGDSMWNQAVFQLAEVRFDLERAKVQGISVQGTTQLESLFQSLRANA